MSYNVPYSRVFGRADGCHSSGCDLLHPDCHIMIHHIGEVIVAKWFYKLCCGWFGQLFRPVSLSLCSHSDISYPLMQQEDRHDLYVVNTHFHIKCPQLKIPPNTVLFQSIVFLKLHLCDIYIFSWGELGICATDMVEMLERTEKSSNTLFVLHCLYWLQ